MPVKPPSLAVLVAITALNPLALNVLQPALPDLARAFATGYGTVQLTLAVYLVASALSQIALGPISDRIGRRPVALGGLAIYIAGSVACIAAGSIGTLVLGRVVQAVGGIAGLVIARAVVRDLHERDAAASRLGYVMMAMVVVPMVSPFIGGWLAETSGHVGVFAFTAAIGLFALAFAFVDLSETRRVSETASSLSIMGAYAALLFNPAFLAHALTMGFTSATFFAFLAGSPYVVVELQGRGPIVFGAWFAVSSAGYMFGNFLSGRLSERIGTRTMVGAGTSLPFVGLGLLAAGYHFMPGEPAVLFVATVPIWIGNGLTLPGAAASALSVRPDLAGAASGLAGAFQLGAGSLSALVVAHVLTDSAWPMIAIMTLTALLALAAHLAGRDDEIAWWRGA
jgi:DHA1 family bicyclomycin/chloramphenicol resistance-like MFS transporter